MKIDIDWDRVSINEKEIRFQYPVDDSIVFQEGVILRLVHQNKPLNDHDFEIDNPSRNVVALTPTGERKWVIESIATGDEDSYHRNLWTVQSRYLTGHTDGNFEFDPESGEILEAWSKTELPIDGSIVDLSGTVQQLFEFNDAIFVRCTDATHILYAFEADGTERWRSDADERRGLLSVEDGHLWEQLAVNRTTDHRYRLDPETGERLECEEIDTGLW